MRPGILPEHCFEPKGNHSLCNFTLVRHKNSTEVRLKGSKEEMRYSGLRRDVNSHVPYRATSGHSLLYMRSDVSKEMSRWRRLLLKVPILGFHVTQVSLIITQVKNKIAYHLINWVKKLKKS